MTEYKCSVCDYTSPQKESVIRHINRKKSCGQGTKEVIEVPVEIVCEYCNKKFASSISLRYHLKNSCKHKDDIKDKEIKELKEKVKELEKQTEKPTVVNNYNTINNTLIINYNDTSLSKLQDKDINRIIEGSEEPYHIIPRLIREVHFNPSIPENHNIFISNRGKNNKHINIYRNGHWEVENKSTEIDNLINDKETNLSDWVSEKGEKYPEALEKFNEYLDQKYDEDVSKSVKEEVELVLYNNRHMANKS